MKLQKLKPLSQKGLPHIIAAVVMMVAVAGVGGSHVAAASPCTSHTYARGSNGKCVKYIQGLINYVTPASAPKLRVDGDFGSKTRAAVRAYQVNNPYGRLVADGIVGPKTWAAICYPPKGPGLPPNFKAAGCQYIKPPVYKD